jgi:hypothetical protein
MRHLLIRFELVVKKLLCHRIHASKEPTVHINIAEARRCIRSLSNDIETLLEYTPKYGNLLWMIIVMIPTLIDKVESLIKLEEMMHEMKKTIPFDLLLHITSKTDENVLLKHNIRTLRHLHVYIANMDEIEQYTNSICYAGASVIPWIVSELRSNSCINTLDLLYKVEVMKRGLDIRFPTFFTITHPPYIPLM